MPHAGNLNLDHRRSCEAAAIACRRAAMQFVREFLHYEVPSSTDWSAKGELALFPPDLFVDINATLDRKMAALAVYRPEMRPTPHARSREVVRALAIHRGMGVGLTAAEAFATSRRILRR